jgi:DNA-binding response OmpR family regulator
MKILIAEDDTVAQEVLASALKSQGYEVMVTSDGEAAWRALQAPDSPRLCIIDRMMPCMDGVSLCKNIRAAESRRSHYLIILTVKGNTEDITEGFAAGADDYVTKPFDRHELEARVRLGKRVVELERALESKP